MQSIYSLYLPSTIYVYIRRYLTPDVEPLEVLRQLHLAGKVGGGDWQVLEVVEWPQERRQTPADSIRQDEATQSGVSDDWLQTLRGNTRAVWNIHRNTRA